jgi:hypothetical protein
MASTRVVMTPGRARWTNAPIRECPNCATICAYWDIDDLDDNGDLLCDNPSCLPTDETCPDCMADIGESCHWQCSAYFD